jgi:hypothetical protein
VYQLLLFANRLCVVQVVAAPIGRGLWRFVDAPASWPVGTPTQANAASPGKRIGCRSCEGGVLFDTPLHAICSTSGPGASDLSDADGLKRNQVDPCARSVHPSGTRVSPGAYETSPDRSCDYAGVAWRVTGGIGVPSKMYARSAAGHPPLRHGPLPIVAAPSRRSGKHFTSLIGLGSSSSGRDPLGPPGRSVPLRNCVWRE